MKTWCTILSFLLTTTATLGNVWQGDYIIETQADADAFRSVCACTSINGNLIITGSEVKHVDSLHAVTHISDSLKILNTVLLNNFYGLRHIQKIGRHLVIKNNQFENIEGFDGLSRLGGSLEIKENENLKNLRGFENLNEVSTNIYISSNPKLTEFTLFKTLKKFQALYIWKNESLTTIKENDFITEIGQIELSQNSKLEKIDGFNRVLHSRSITIRSNPSLRIINAFQKLKNTISLRLTSLDKLETLNAFGDLYDINLIFEVKLPDQLLDNNYFRNLTIVKHRFITNIRHFEKLIEVDEFWFESYSSIKLDTIFGSSSLKKINRIIVNGQEKLKYITGFDSLKQVRSISIENNKNLTAISGFNQLEKVESVDSYSNPFYIISNESLEVIEGFSAFKKLSGNVRINSNGKLKSITAFDQLELIQGSRSEIFLTEEFSNQNIFKNLKTIDGGLKTNFTNYPALENVSGLNINDDIVNKDTLYGFRKLKQANFINISGNYKLVDNAAFQNLEVVNNISIRGHENLVDIAGFNKLTVIESDLIITDNSSLKNISGFTNLITVKSNLYLSDISSLINFTGFSKLNTVLGRFSFNGNNSTTFSGFNKIKKIGELEFYVNNHLKSITGFNELKEIGLLEIHRNDNIEDIEGFPNLSSVTNFKIVNNVNLKHLQGFHNLTDVHNFDITRNTNLQEINAFENLLDVNEIKIDINNNLLSIKGFNKLTNISSLSIENRNLRVLDAFANLKVIDDFSFTNNIQLRSIGNFTNLGIINNSLFLENNLQLNDCCNLTCLVGSIPGITNIYNNGSKCFTWHEILINCPENNCLEKEDLLSDLSIQTNPVTESQQLEFSFITFEEQPANYTIYSISDQLLAEGSVSSIIGYNRKVIDLPAIQKGYYILVLSNEKTAVFGKFVKM